MTRWQPLPESLGTEATAALRDTLARLPSNALLDARGVRTVGALAAQLLVFETARRARDGDTLRIAASHDMREDLRLLGLEVHLNIEGDVE